jgi:hypothetical protein
MRPAHPTTPIFIAPHSTLISLDHLERSGPCFSTIRSPEQPLKTADF